MEVVKRMNLFCLSFKINTVSLRKAEWESKDAIAKDANEY